MTSPLYGLCVLLLALVGTWSAGPAQAYIGPGAGLGAMAVAVALFAGIGLLIVGLVWFPLKRMLKRRKQSADTRDTRQDS